MRKTFITVMGGVAVVAVVCMVMLSRIHQRMVVSIDSFDLRTDTVTVGNGSTMHFDNIPHDYVAVVREGDSLSWKVNDHYLLKDSLFYMKVNGENPNRNAVNPLQTIVVEGGERTFRLTAKDVDRLLDGHKSQYVLLRHALEKLEKSQSRDLLAGKYEDVKSFFYRDKTGLFKNKLGPWQLVILDTKTSIESPKDTIRYKTQGRVGGHFKVQFYHMMDKCIRNDNKELFHIDNISYIAKPMLVTTQWGAGHGTVSCGEGMVTVRYPKPLTYTEDKEELFNDIHDNVNLMTLRQDDGGMPMGHDVVLPRFSASVPTEICHVKTVGRSLSIGDQILKPVVCLLPVLPRMTINAGTAALHVRSGVIGTAFILSYLWLPLLVFIIITIAYPMLTNVNDNRFLTPSEDAGKLPYAFWMVTSIAFTYSMCRACMVIKLSWTFPYFEVLTSISPVSAALMLNLTFLLSLLLNHDFLDARPISSHGSKKKAAPWLAVTTGVLTTVLCSSAYIYMEDKSCRDALASYLPEKLLTLWPLDWRLLRPNTWVELDNVMDLHRSVPFTLLWFNGVTLAILAILNVTGTPQKKLAGWRASIGKPPSWLSGADLSALAIALAFAVLTLAASALPGNYTTAAIMFFLISGAGCSIGSMDYKSNRYVALLVTLTIGGMLFLGATSLPHADKGFLTNTIGFLALAVILFMAARKRAGANGSLAEETWQDVCFTQWVAVLSAAAIIVGLPLAFRLALDPEDVTYGKAERRFMSNSQLEEYLASGYRYAVSDAEFMVVMTHSMYNASGEDPLSPERHPLHPSISSGQAPVVLNDLSVPVAFFGTYGWAAYVAYFALVALLLAAVTATTLPSPGETHTTPVDAAMLWRLLAVFMFAGTTCYLYASYVGVLPFTGRNNPALGIDSVGEAIESSFLLAFMTATTLRPKDLN